MKICKWIAELFQDIRSLFYSKNDRRLYRLLKTEEGRKEIGKRMVSPIRDKYMDVSVKDMIDIIDIKKEKTNEHT